MTRVLAVEQSRGQQVFVLKTVQGLLDVDGQPLNVDHIHSMVTGHPALVSLLRSKLPVPRHGLLQEDVDEVGTGADLATQNGQ